MTARYPGAVIIAIFRRRLRDGATSDDFIGAWEADKGFGVPARVFNAVSLENSREILSVGFVAPVTLRQPPRRSAFRRRCGTPASTM